MNDIKVEGFFAILHSLYLIQATEKQYNRI